ncbi:MAG TPA: hypothetical protein VFH41_06380, partial [Bradyrhizobium sp.]|nr:hypothetical protein [Bradyrhizobium sp.]
LDLGQRQFIDGLAARRRVRLERWIRQTLNPKDRILTDDTRIMPGSKPAAGFVCATRARNFHVKSGPICGIYVYLVSCTRLTSAAPWRKIYAYERGDKLMLAAKNIADISTHLE